MKNRLPSFLTTYSHDRSKRKYRRIWGRPLTTVFQNVRKRNARVLHESWSVGRFVPVYIFRYAGFHFLVGSTTTRSVRFRKLTRTPSPGAAETTRTSRFHIFVLSSVISRDNTAARLRLGKVLDSSETTRFHRRVQNARHFRATTSGVDDRSTTMVRSSGCSVRLRI